MGINTRNLKLLAFGMGATFGGVSGVMFASFQGFISPESFSLQESIDDRRDGRAGRDRPHPGRDRRRVSAGGAARGAALRRRPLQAGGHRGPARRSILRQLLIALAMISIMLLRPRGLWPAREHGHDGDARDAARASPCRPDAAGADSAAGHFDRTDRQVSRSTGQ